MANRGVRLVEVDFWFQVGEGKDDPDARQFVVRVMLLEGKVHAEFDLHGSNGPIEHLQPQLLAQIGSALEFAQAKVTKEDLVEEE